MGRDLREQVHQVRLVPAQSVKRYVQTNKNYYLGAEAVQRPRTAICADQQGGVVGSACSASRAGVFSDATHGEVVRRRTSHFESRPSTIISGWGFSSVRNL